MARSLVGILRCDTIMSDVQHFGHGGELREVMGSYNGIDVLCLVVFWSTF